MAVKPLGLKPLSEGLAKTAGHDRPALLQLTATAGFGTWLAEQGGFLAFSTLTAETLVILSAARDGGISSAATHLGFMRGLAADAATLWAAGDTRLWQLGNVGPHLIGDVEHDAVYVLRSGHFVGSSLLHDVAQNVAFGGERHPIVYVNTNFSVIAALDPVHSFRPLWKPRFVSALAAEDRCHLNCLALRDGEAAFVTAFSATDAPEAWRAAGPAPGIVIDIASHEIVCTGLSAPHTPRWYRDGLWIANSGQGEFGFVDFATGRFEVVTKLGGFVRGLAMVGDYAVVGMSSRRQSPFTPKADIPGLVPVESKTSGLFVVDLRSGAVVEALTIRGSPGIYDVVHVPGIRRPFIVKTPDSKAELKTWTTFSQPPWPTAGPA